MYILHEGLDVDFWNLEVGEPIYEVLMNGSSYIGCDGNERVGFPSFVCYDVDYGSEPYLVCLCERACYGNLSWQYVNYMNWIVWVWEGVMGTCVWFGAPSMHNISGLSMA